MASAIVQSVDIFPTLCEMVGLEVPVGLDGRSMRPLLENPDGKSRGFAYANFSNRETIRTEEYRYTSHKGGFSEVYDLKSDPGEEHNVAEQNAEVIDKMRAKLAVEVPNRER